MIRNKSLLVFISLLLFGATALVDTRHYYLDVEELVESLEAEREELKEGMEGKDWSKDPHGGQGFYIDRQSFLLNSKSCLRELHVNRQKTLSYEKDVPLFIKYCCLKVHIG